VSGTVDACQWLYMMRCAGYAAADYWSRMNGDIGDEMWSLRGLTSESASMADLVDVLDIEIAVSRMCGLVIGCMLRRRRKSR